MHAKRKLSANEAKTPRQQAQQQQLQPRHNPDVLHGLLSRLIRVCMHMCLLNGCDIVCGECVFR